MPQDSLDSQMANKQGKGIEDEDEPATQALDEDDVVIMRTYGVGPYVEPIKVAEKEAKEYISKINKLIGVKESDTGLAPPSQWDLEGDKQMMKQEQALQVARVTKIIDPGTDDTKYVIKIRELRHERHLPLGRSAVGLSPASGVVLLVLSVLLLFGCLCGIWRCRRPEVLPERGQRRCGELGQQTFMVVPKQGPKKPTSTLLDQVPGKPKEAAHARAQAAAGETAMSPMAPRPSHASKASKASKASSSRLARVVSAVSLLRPSKIHVVWQLNLQHVQDWLAGRTTIPPECVREAETQEETRAEPDADLEVASESCPQLPRQRSSALVASQHMAKPKKESNFFAAYSSGDKVEYFSATQGKWLLGEVHVQPVRGKTPFVYSVTLYRLAQQLPHVEQEMLRLPFAAGEPCELWSSSEERWIEAEIVGMEAGSTPVRQYKVQCLSGDPLLVQASMLRRCFPEGSQVRVYQGATQGFCHARVAGPSEAFRPNLEAQQSRTAPDGPLDYHVMVPILKASREKATVPSFFLRLERQLLGTRASADTKWKKTLAAKIGVAKRP